MEQVRVVVPAMACHGLTRMAGGFSRAMAAALLSTFNSSGRNVCAVS